jgi:hypothetical protein
MKRKERNPNDMEDLGPSWSQLRALESAKRIQRQLAPIQWDVDRVRNAQRSVGFDASQVDAIAGASGGYRDTRPRRSQGGPQGSQYQPRRGPDQHRRLRVNLSDFRPHRAHEHREDGKRSPASSRAVIEHLIKAWKGLR